MATYWINAVIRNQPIGIEIALWPVLKERTRLEPPAGCLMYLI